MRKKKLVIQRLLYNKFTMSTISVIVPATTANIGPAFDCIGSALTMYNQFYFAKREKDESQLNINVIGKEASKVKCDYNNLVYKAFTYLYRHIGEIPPKISIKIKLGIPLSRGLGSSATAIIGGLIGANELAGQPLSKLELMNLAIKLEGHPDNVVPALFGKCQLSIKQGIDWEAYPINWHSSIIPLIVIPDFELLTEKARSVIPKTVSIDDAIFNIAHMGLLIKSLEIGNGKWLSSALQDKLHQPYRQNLIKGYDIVRQAAIRAGAYGVVISGAGPTLLVLTSFENISSIECATKEAWLTQAVTSETKLLSIDNCGARINYFE
ncbi:MAG: homoserine kinase [Candidatus Atelocyanobacterium thalassa isolate SIO64986]|uniref:Homoserine kinase n=1 Tax=Candidatus Atelocyanobacterium thalassa isolate SIO64986 TaxID=1527444 RepID=A0A086CI51_9CHRO|nr:MAG: homoserine kinase [Candidatus Atelocyanobacterium thalassa isolate SIO64986]